MSRLERLFRPITPEKLVAQHPLGCLIYYLYDHGARRRINNVLKGALPGHFIAVIKGSPLGFPADSGQQVGRYLYNIGLARIFCCGGIREITGLGYEKIYPIIPPDRKPWIDGGATVPVGGDSKVIMYADWRKRDYWETDIWNPIFRAASLSPVDITGLTSVMEEIGGRVPDEERWVYQTGRGKGHGNHIDLIMTAFSQRPGGLGHSKARIYVDELVYPQLAGVCPVLSNIGDVICFPHGLTIKGGLNIQYVFNGTNWLALVPSRRVLGEIGPELERCGYEIVEVGEGEVANGGGIKCRSLLIRWSR